jgi:hypothetical protein
MQNDGLNMSETILGRVDVPVDRKVSVYWAHVLIVIVFGIFHSGDCLNEACQWRWEAGLRIDQGSYQRPLPQSTLGPLFLSHVHGI